MGSTVPGLLVSVPGTGIGCVSAVVGLARKMVTRERPAGKLVTVGVANCASAQNEKAVARVATASEESAGFIGILMGGLGLLIMRREQKPAKDGLAETGVFRGSFCISGLFRSGRF